MMEHGFEGTSGSGSGSAEVAIDSSNVGFKLLKKHGWKEGTGLGASEQGRLEPVEAHWKNNKRGLGAERVKDKSSKPAGTKHATGSYEKNQEEPPVIKPKGLTKKMRKMQELEKKLKEKEFEIMFSREFWPDNV